MATIFLLARRRVICGAEPARPTHDCIACVRLKMKSKCLLLLQVSNPRNLVGFSLRWKEEILLLLRRGRLLRAHPVESEISSLMSLAASAER